MRCSEFLRYGVGGLRGVWIIPALLVIMNSLPLLAHHSVAYDLVPGSNALSPLIPCSLLILALKPPPPSLVETEWVLTGLFFACDL
jgi:hypothetical protein